MEFYTSSKYKRPHRLSEETRRFAYESLEGRYGRDALLCKNVSLGHVEGYGELSPLGRYDAALREIAEKAPIRICEGELISGAATFGDGAFHLLPACYGEDERGYDTAVSHHTPDFTRVLKEGMDGIRVRVEDALKKHTDPYKREFLESCLNTIDAMKIWHKRYLLALCEKEGYEKNTENLKKVPFSPATTFYEAVQSLWFTFAFLRLCGNWPGIGRIDVMLGDYLKKDLAEGRITLPEAREILAHFWIKGCEWIGAQTVKGSGDAQHYQNIVLAGVDEEGAEVTNEVTYLVLDIVEETGISDFPVTVRLNTNTDEKLLRRVAEVIRYGGGVVAVYNEDLILKSLVDMGYEEKEARGFANDGCWEVQIPGKTNFSYIPFDGLALFQRVTLKGYEEEVSFQSFEELLSAYEENLEREVEEIFHTVVEPMFADEDTYKKEFPCTAVSLLEEDCIGRGLSYREGGTLYRVVSPHIGGLPDVVNSLYAIKKLVFDEKAVTFRKFMEILKNNWEGEEALRRKILQGYRYYGNDNDEVDEIAAEILKRLADACKPFDRRRGVRFVSGVSTFGRQIEWAPSRMATPFGRRAGDILSGNLSPTPGTELEGATAVIKSYCKADLSKQHTGAALDIGFLPSNLEGEQGIDALVTLMKGFLALGGFFMQIDTADKEVLTDAQRNPENYPELAVRVSGWSARFVTMSKEWQDMVIERAK